MKFYTEEGNWDLVGNNTPVFFIRDPMRFPDLNRAVKRDPETNLRSAKNNWDFWTLLPEALHQVTITMSDRGISKSYRHMNGYGSHTFAMYNAQNERVWVKFHLKTQQGIEYLTDEEAEQLIGKDRESHQNDLFNSIKNCDYPRWTMAIQVMTEAQAEALPYNPFDVTKVWFKSDFPLIEVGYFELNRNPENYFRDVEQAAFNPASIVPGIGFSPDRMLQGRLFSYGDAQRYRLGVNHELIPVNQAKNKVNTYHRDGLMRVDDNGGAKTHYWPNSDQEWQDHPHMKEPPLKLRGDAEHYDFREDDDDYFTQPGKLFNLMSPSEKERLFSNTKRNMGNIPKEIKIRHIKHCYLADPEYGKGIAKSLDIPLSEAGF
jgi:catalase